MKSPAAESGTLSHQSSLRAGMHQHMFTKATQKLSVNTGDSLYTYVYIDPANAPSEIMLQWNDGSTWFIARIGERIISSFTVNGDASLLTWERFRRPASGCVSKFPPAGEARRHNGQRHGVLALRRTRQLGQLRQINSVAMDTPPPTNSVPTPTNSVPTPTNSVPAPTIRFPGRTTPSGSTMHCLRARSLMPGVAIHGTGLPPVLLRNSARKRISPRSARAFTSISSAAPPLRCK